MHVVHVPQRHQSSEQILMDPAPLSLLNEKTLNSFQAIGEEAVDRNKKVIMFFQDFFHSWSHKSRIIIFFFKKRGPNPLFHNCLMSVTRQKHVILSFYSIFYLYIISPKKLLGTCSFEAPLKILDSGSMADFVFFFWELQK